MLPDGDAPEPRLGLFQAGAGGHCFVLEAADGEFCGLKLAPGDGAVGFGAGERAVGFGKAGIRGAAGVAGALVGGGEFGKAGLQRLVRLTGAVGAGGDVFEVALQLDEAVELLQAQGGGGGGILGPSAKTVPTPEVALDADEALAGFELRLELEALLAGDEADLRQAARQNGGGLDAGA